MSYRRLLVALVHSGLTLAICDAQTPARPGQTTLDEFVRGLRAQQVRATIAGAVPRSDTPYFSVAATRVQVAGTDVFVFQYPNGDAAAAEAARVTPDGQPSPTARIMWIGKPHFFRKDRIIVLYAGCADNIAGVLTAALGPPFVVGSGLC